MKNGYDVTVCYDRDDSAADEARKEFEALGYAVTICKADVSKEEDVSGMFESFFERHPKMDLLVNNAAVPLYRQIQDTTYEQYRRTFDVNFGGCFNCAKEASRRMLPFKDGCIVNIASIWGEVGASCESVYSAAKGAVISFTKALAKELAPSGIRVNAISPGVISTDMNAHLNAEERRELEEQIPLGRFGTPEEIGEACLYLANAQYVTGEILSVGGGFDK